MALLKSDITVGYWSSAQNCWLEPGELWHTFHCALQELNRSSPCFLRQAGVCGNVLSFFFFLQETKDLCATCLHCFN